jgi:uncharacterized protein
MSTVAKSLPARERRCLTAAGEMRAVRAEGKPITLVGYAAKFDVRSENLGWFVEVLKPGCFAKVLREGQDIRFLFNHDSSRIFGRTANGTLRLKEDAVGLHFECDLPDTEEARTLATLVERGDISGNSFSFRSTYPTGYDWVETPLGDSPPLRVVREIDQVWDVGPVTYPAYEDTEVDVRALEDSRKAARETPNLDAIEDRFRQSRLAKLKARRDPLGIEG